MLVRGLYPQLSLRTLLINQSPLQMLGEHIWPDMEVREPMENQEAASKVHRDFEVARR